MEEHDIVILGAGISGLSMAHHAARLGLTTRLIDSANRVGGALHTHHCDRDFWIELGAHTCYNSYTALIEILEQATRIDQLIGREKVPFRLWIDGQIRSIPSQISFLGLLMSAPRMFFLDKSRETVESYYRKIVGKKNFQKVFQHMFNAVPSQRSNDFPADMLFKKRQRRKDLLRSFTLRDGLGSLAESIAGQPDIHCETGNAAMAITMQNKRFSIALADGQTCVARYLAMATPAAEAARLLQQVNPTLAGELEKISVNRFESTGVIVDKDDLSLEPVAAIVPTDADFYSVVSRDTVAHPASRGFTFHFKTGQQDRQAQLQTIAAVIGVPVNKFREVANKTNVLPSFRTGHGDWLERVDAQLAGERLLLTGNYLAGMSIEDCVRRSGTEATRLAAMVESPGAQT